VAIENSKLQLMMAHTAPYNAIIEYSKTNVPTEQWTHLALTYDGSAKASGLRIYLNGTELQTTIDQDNLYKDIMFKDPKTQPGLQFGGWDRGKGFTGGLQRDITVFSRDLAALEVLQLADQKKFKAIVNKEPEALGASEMTLLKDFTLLPFLYNKKN
jgi:hypothetical protein